MSKKKADRVKEPMQVYLAESDRSLLDELALTRSVSRAEVLRQGIRRLAMDRVAESTPGRSLDALIGAFGDAADIPADLSVRHDEYLYPAPGDDGSRGD